MSSAFSLFPPLDSLLIVAIVACVTVAPYTKVEESFNIQACYDMLKYGVTPDSIQNYDHLQFPGVVPRTFLGSLLLTTVSKLMFATGLFHQDTSDFASQLNDQVLMRCILGVINAVILNRVRKQLVESTMMKSKYVGIWYAILQLTQFHLIFYSSRFLPNFLALPFTNYALSEILVGNYESLFWFGFTGTVFRLEVGLFGSVIAVVSALFRQSSFSKNIINMLKGVVLGLIISICVDSYFWRKFPSLPELSSFYFNIVEGKSVEWGVEPYGAYFTKYLKSFYKSPIMLLLTIPGFFYDTTGKNTLRVLAVSIFSFIALMSFQPHKEWRFIVYVVPGITCLMANGVNILTVDIRKSVLAKIVTFVVLVSTLISIFGSVVMVYVSSLNYPGGVAITTLNGILTEKFTVEQLSVDPIIIHMDVPACMTGVTLFTELQSQYINYDKTEDVTALYKKWDTFNYLISSTDIDRNDTQNNEQPVILESQWKKLKNIQGFKRINVLPAIKLVRNLGNLADIVEELILKVSFEPIMEVINEMVIQDDQLFIYERISQ